MKSKLLKEFLRGSVLLCMAVCAGPPVVAQASANNPETEPTCLDYYFGVGVPRSAVKAFQCFQTSSDGSPDYIWLILMTLNGEGTPQSVRHARELLAEAKKEPTHVADVGILEDNCCDQDSLDMAEQNIASSEANPSHLRGRLNICDFAAGTNNYAICLEDFEGILNSKHEADFQQIAAKLSPAAKAAFEQVRRTFQELKSADSDWKLEEHDSGTGRGEFAESQSLSDDLDFASLVRRVVRDHRLKARSQAEFQFADKRLNEVYQNWIKTDNGGKEAFFESARKAERVWIRLEDPWKKLCEELYRGEMPPAAIDRAIGTELRAIRTLEIQESGDHDFFASDDPELQHFDHGYELLNHKSWDQAIEEYEEVIRLNPENAAAYSAIGSALEGKKDWDGAIREYREALHMNPDDADAHRGLGWSLENKKDWDSAVAEYRKTVALWPDWPDAETRLITVFEQQRDWDGAAGVLREEIHRHPDNADAHRGLCWELGQEKNWGGAIAEGREAIRLDPDSALAHGCLGWALENTKDWDGAIREYRETIRLSPKWANPHNNFAEVLHEKGDQDGAIAEAREALRLDPTLAGAHVNIGDALHKKGDLDGAIAEFREATRISPEYPVGHGNLAWALDQKGDHDSAIAEYRELIRLTPDDPEGHAGIAEALEHKGDDQAAMEEYHKASELDSKNRGYRDNYERLREQLKK